VGSYKTTYTTNWEDFHNLVRIDFTRRRQEIPIDFKSLEEINVGVFKNIEDQIFNWKFFIDPVLKWIISENDNSIEVTEENFVSLERTVHSDYTVVITIIVKSCSEYPLGKVFTTSFDLSKI